MASETIDYAYEGLPKRMTDKLVFFSPLVQQAFDSLDAPPEGVPEILVMQVQGFRAGDPYLEIEASGSCLPQVLARQGINCFAQWIEEFAKFNPLKSLPVKGSICFGSGNTTIPSNPLDLRK